MSYLLDTNVLSEAMRKQPDSRVRAWLERTPDELMYVSVLSLGELRKGIEGVADTARRERLRQWLEADVPDWFGDRILPVDECVADRCGRMCAAIGRPVPAIDSLLAATALRHDLRLVTRNTREFEGFGLGLVNLWEA